MRTVYLLVTAFVMISCDDVPSRDLQAIVSDSAGVRIVDNSAEDHLLDWKFERVWSIGGEDDYKLQLSQLGRHQIGASMNGQIFVLDALANRVHILSLDGLHVGSFGRHGSGPGELRTPLALTLDNDGSVTVYDLERGMLRWSADGDPLATTAIGLPFWGPLLRHTRDGFLFTARGRTPENVLEYRLVHWNRDETDIIARAIRLEDHRADFPSCNLRQVTVSPLFSPALVWDSFDDLIAVNATSNYIIDIYEGGRPALSIRRKVGLRPVDQGIARRQVGSGWSIPGLNCTIPANEAVRGRGYAAHIPSIMAIAISPSGEIWVQRGKVSDEPVQIDVFAADGAYLGTLHPDSPFPAAFADSALIVTVEPDSMDVPRIALYRVVHS